MTTPSGEGYLLNVCQPYKSENITFYKTGGNDYFTVAGVKRQDGFKVEQSYIGAGAYFNLDGNYNEIAFTVGTDDSRVYSHGTVSVYIDEKFVEDISINYNDMPITHTYNVTGKTKFALDFPETTIGVVVYDIRYSSDTVSLPAASKASTPEPGKTGYLLKDYALYRIVNKIETFEEFGREHFTVVGVDRTDGIVVEDGSASEAYFNLNGEVNTIEFTMAYVDTDEPHIYGESGALSIYVDGKFIEEISTEVGIMPTSYSYNVAGANQLALLFSTYSNGMAIYDIRYSSDSVSMPEASSKTAPELGNTGYLLKDRAPYRLTKLKTYTDGGKDHFTVMGVDRTDGIVANTDFKSAAYFNLNGEINRLEFTMAPVDTREHTEGTISVYIDGRFIEELSAYSGTMPITYTYDVTGAKQFSLIYSGYNEGVAVYDIRYSSDTVSMPAASTNTAPEKGNTGNLLIDSAPYRLYNVIQYVEGQRDSFTVDGEEYHDGLVSNNYSGTACAYFNLNGEYSSVSFTIALIDTRKYSKGTMSVCVDGEVVEELSVNVGTASTEHTYIVYGAKQLSLIYSWGFAGIAVYNVQGQ